MSGEPGKTPTTPIPRWYDPLVQLGKTLRELGFHVLMVVAILGSIKIVQKTLVLFWGTEDLMFFGWFKVKYVLEAAELFILIAFLWIVSGKFVSILRKG